MLSPSAAPSPSEPKSRPRTIEDQSVEAVFQRALTLSHRGQLQLYEKLRDLLADQGPKPTRQDQLLERQRQALEAMSQVSSDPNVLFHAADEVRAFGVITDEELDAFVHSWGTLDDTIEEKRHAILSTSTQTAFTAAHELAQDTRREFREALDRSVRFYGFLSQALPWIPPSTEVLYQFSKVLVARLRGETVDGGVDISGTVELTHYRLSQLDTEAITLGDDATPLSAITGDGTGSGVGPGQIPMSKLGELVELFNERYGAELGDTDALKVVTDVRDAVRNTNPELADQASANTREDFVAERDELLIDAALSVGTDRERQARLLTTLLDDEDFRDCAGALIFGSIYDTYTAEIQ